MAQRHVPLGAFRASAPLGIVLAGALGLILLLPAPAGADFGIAQADVTFTDALGFPVSQAGAHPVTWTTSLTMNTTPAGEPDGQIRTLRVQLPPGFIGALALLSRCSHAAFDANSCPTAAAVGRLEAVLSGLGLTEAQLYNLAPSPGAAAEIGASAAGYTSLVRLTVATKPPYNVVATFANVPISFSAATVTIDSAGPFLVMPRTCGAPLTTTFEAQSREQPATWVKATATTHDDATVPNPLALSACERLSYSPTLDVRPTSGQPAAPTGLDLTLNAPDSSFGQASSLARADTAKVVLALPSGMSVNPAVASGLDTCTPAELVNETPESIPGVGCPEASKLGSAELRTPFLDQPVPGSVFVAQPDDPATTEPGAENPFDSLLALYLVLREPERGIFVSIPIEVSADPGTGRLTATIDPIPQLPISRLTLNLRSGPRAPLSNPGDCASHQLSYRLTPSSAGPPLERSMTFPAALSCAAPAFQPSLSAGTANASSGRSSPFVLDLASGADEQNLSSLSLSLPPGLSADLGSVPLCPEERTGSGACPLDSKVGYARIALGAGSEPLWVPAGQDPDSAVYLAGPYKGAPYSLIIAVPAKAGPFDLGTIVTRAAIAVDLESAQVSVDLDPLPQIRAGIPLQYRDLRLVLDRPGFIRNPTNCEPLAVRGEAISVAGRAVGLSNHFQVGSCASLAFKPALSMRLLGSSRRSAHPGLRAKLTAREGDANLSRATITLPGAELLDNRRLRSVCTRARFAEGTCPARSIYGHAEVRSPLLARPLTGPIYLRESEGRLPDLVASLDGPIHLDLTARLDSTHGRLRASFSDLPDAPLGELAFTLTGGRRGILVNTGGLCAGKSRSSARLRGQNGKLRTVEPVVKVDCGNR